MTERRDDDFYYQSAVSQNSETQLDDKKEFISEEEAFNQIKSLEPGKNLEIIISDPSSVKNIEFEFGVENDLRFQTTKQADGLYEIQIYRLLDEDNFESSLKNFLNSSAIYLGLFVSEEDPETLVFYLDQYKQFLTWDEGYLDQEQFLEDSSDRGFYLFSIHKKPVSAPQPVVNITEETEQELKNVFLSDPTEPARSDLPIETLDTRSDFTTARWSETAPGSDQEENNITKRPELQNVIPVEFVSDETPQPLPSLKKTDHRISPPNKQDLETSSYPSRLESGLRTTRKPRRNDDPYLSQTAVRQSSEDKKIKQPLPKINFEQALPILKELKKGTWIEVIVLDVSELRRIEGQIRRSYSSYRFQSGLMDQKRYLLKVFHLIKLQDLRDRAGKDSLGQAGVLFIDVLRNTLETFLQQHFRPDQYKIEELAEFGDTVRVGNTSRNFFEVRFLAQTVPLEREVLTPRQTDKGTQDSPLSSNNTLELGRRPQKTGKVYILDDDSPSSSNTDYSLTLSSKPNDSSKTKTSYPLPLRVADVYEEVAEPASGNLVLANKTQMLSLLFKKEEKGNNSTSESTQFYLQRGFKPNETQKILQLKALFENQTLTFENLTREQSQDFLRTCMAECAALSNIDNVWPQIRAWLEIQQDSSVNLQFCRLIAPENLTTELNDWLNGIEQLEIGRFFINGDDLAQFGRILGQEQFCHIIKKEEYVKFRGKKDDPRSFVEIKLMNPEAGKLKTLKDVVTGRSTANNDDLEAADRFEDKLRNAIEQEGDLTENDSFEARSIPVRKKHSREREGPTPPQSENGKIGDTEPNLLEKVLKQTSLAELKKRRKMPDLETVLPHLIAVVRELITMHQSKAVHGNLNLSAITWPPRKNKPALFPEQEITVDKMSYAPEQHVSGPVNMATDVYSLGILLHNVFRRSGEEPELIDPFPGEKKFKAPSLLFEHSKRNTYNALFKKGTPADDIFYYLAKKHDLTEIIESPLSRHFSGFTSDKDVVQEAPNEIRKKLLNLISQMIRFNPQKRISMAEVLQVLQNVENSLKGNKLAVTFLKNNNQQTGL